MAHITNKNLHSLTRTGGSGFQRCAYDDRERRGFNTPDPIMQPTEVSFAGTTVLPFSHDEWSSGVLSRYHATHAEYCSYCPGSPPSGVYCLLYLLKLNFLETQQPSPFVRNIMSLASNGPSFDGELDLNVSLTNAPTPYESDCDSIDYS